MLAKLIFTYCSILFAGILFIPYVTKNNQKSVSVYIYKWLVTDSIFLIFSEVFVVASLKYIDSKIVMDIFTKLHWTTGYFFFFFLYFYIYSSVYNDVDNYKLLIMREKKTKMFFIFTLVMYFISLLIKIPNMNENTFTFLPGFYAYFSLAYMTISIINIFFFTRKYSSNHRVKRALGFGMFAIAIILTLQFMLPKTALFGLGIAWGLYILYFNIENPDLKLIEATDKLKVSAEKSSRAKSDFLSNMSQEIISPMNAIVGFSETILSDKTFNSEAVIEDLNCIKMSSESLLDVIDNILDISKIETGEDTIENREYSLKDLVLNWNNFVNTRLEGKKIKFILNVESTLPSKYVGDASKINQIVSNLLSNATKYTKVGKIKMDITGIRDNSGNVNLKFIVSDTGFGIKDEDKDKIFNKAPKSDSSKANDDEGSGLGLALIKKYVDLMGGKLWFESDYGVGSTFYFEVPQKASDVTAIGNVMETVDENKKALSNFEGKKILIVDDDELSLKVIKRLLRAYNIETVGITDPNDCIYRIKMGEEYDLIFLDHMLKQIDGVELCKTLRQFSGYKIPPIVMLTANALVGVRDYYLKNGFSEYLSKPINLNELDRVINLYLK